jgi:hypothetical protein
VRSAKSCAEAGSIIVDAVRQRAALHVATTSGSRRLRSQPEPLALLPIDSTDGDSSVVWPLVLDNSDLPAGEVVASGLVRCWPQVNARPPPPPPKQEASTPVEEDSKGRGLGEDAGLFLKLQLLVHDADAAALLRSWLLERPGVAAPGNMSTAAVPLVSCTGQACW